MNRPERNDPPVGWTIVELADNGSILCDGPGGERRRYWLTGDPEREETTELVDLWLIKCRTGCTCCSGENHFRGPYRDKESAERRRDSFLAKDSKFWPVASQYARRGSYSIACYQAEPITKGRFILDDLVVGDIRFVEVAEDGSVDDNEAERFDLELQGARHERT